MAQRNTVKRLTLIHFVLDLVVRVHSQHEQVSRDVVDCCIRLDGRKKKRQISDSATIIPEMK